MGIAQYIFEKIKNWMFANNHRPDFSSITEIDEIANIFAWLHSSNPEISTSCADTIHRLLTNQRVFKNNHLYRSLRYISIKKEDLAKFRKFKTEFRNSLWCIASMNGDGYVREAALNLLIELPTQNTFPYIVFRLGDWVPVIKQTAERGIREVLQRQTPRLLIRHYKIIDWLVKIGRHNLQEIYQEIMEFIFSDRNIEQVMKNIDSYTEGERYFLFRNLVLRNKVDSWITEKMLADKNHLIRLLAVRNVNLIEHPEILKKLLADRTQKIRHYTINKIPETQLDQFTSELHNLLFDSSSAIRAIARSRLSRKSEQDYPQIYREELYCHPTVGSIIGLSEVGSEDDIEQFTIFLTSPSATLRAASLYALSNVGYRNAKEHAFALLGDSSNTVKRVCGSIILREKSRGDLPVLRKYYDREKPETKGFILKVINKYGGWDIIGDILKGVSDTDATLHQMAYGLLHRWYHYSVRLATSQKAGEKIYVMGIYESIHWDNLKLPTDVKRIVDRIPFIFGDK